MTDALDGNAAAGALADVFALDMTVAVTPAATVVAASRPAGR